MLIHDMSGLPRVGDTASAASSASTGPVTQAGGDLTGRLLGSRYRLLRPLGAHASLYLAWSVVERERVLIRILPGVCTGEAVQRFLAALRAATGVRHGHVVHVTDGGIDAIAGGTPAAYVVMECLRGENLTTTLVKHGPLHWTRAVAIARQVCRALITLHGRGLVHGGIRPDACFRVRRRDTTDFIKLIDLGLAGVVGAAGCCPAAPAERADDLRALGVLMFRMLTNRAPGAAQSPTRRALQDLDVPPALAAVILGLLPREPGGRPTSARAVYHALVAIEPPAAAVAEEEPTAVLAAGPASAVSTEIQGAGPRLWACAAPSDEPPRTATLATPALFPTPAAAPPPVPLADAASSGRRRRAAARLDLAAETATTLPTWRVWAPMGAAISLAVIAVTSGVAMTAARAATRMPSPEAAGAPAVEHCQQSACRRTRARAPAIWPRTESATHRNRVLP